MPFPHLSPQLHTYLIPKAHILGPFLFFKYDALELRQSLLDSYPELDLLLPHEPSIIAAPLFTLPNNSIPLTIALYLYSLYVPFTFFSGFAIYLIFLKMAFNSKNFISNATYQNYLIVVRAKTIQICSVSILMFFPYLIQFIVFSLKLKNGSLIALLAHFPPSYHLFFEILALFYFVKPYREYIKKKFRKDW